MSAGIKAPKKLIEVAPPLDGGGSDLDIRSKNSFLSKLLQAEISRLGAPPVRQGDDRILYAVSDAQVVIEMVKAGHRREVYRGR